MKDSCQSASCIHHLVRRILATIAVTVSLGACAQISRSSHLESFLAPVPRDQGRIYAFDDKKSPRPVAIPRIHFSGQTIGSNFRRSAFFFEVPPGTYEAHAANKTANDKQIKEQSVSSLVAAAGEEKFVQFKILEAIPLGKGGSFFADSVLYLVTSDKGRATSWGLLSSLEPRTSSHRLNDIPVFAMI